MSLAPESAFPERATQRMVEAVEESEKKSVAGDV